MMRIDQNLIKSLVILETELRREKVPYVVIGALVPALLIDLTENITGSAGSRITRDIDIAVKTDTWSRYERLLEKLKKAGFERKKGAQEHRLFMNDRPIDIIPLGDDIIKDNMFVWPSSGREMSVAGLNHAFDNCLFIPIEENIEIPVLSLPVSAYSKLMAYSDRKDRKDLEDTVYILTHYEEIEISERRFELPNVYQIEYDIRGAFLLGTDLGKVISKKERDRLISVVGESIIPDRITLDYLSGIFHEGAGHISHLLSEFVNGLSRK